MNFNLAAILAYLRGWHTDRAKAKQYLSNQASEEYRQFMASYDAQIADLKQSSEKSIFMGTAMDSGGHEVPLHLSLTNPPGNSITIGGPGTGKTTMTGVRFSGLIANCEPAGAVDFKSDLFELVTHILGAYVYTLPEPEQASFIKHIHVVNAFAKTLAPLNLCAHLPGVSTEVQAYRVAQVLTRLFDTMSDQMETILRNLLSLLIEFELSLVEAPRILNEEELLHVLAQCSKQPEVQRFFLQTYPQFQAISKNALLTRLSSILIFDNIRLMLGSETSIDLKKMFNNGYPLNAYFGKDAGIPEELMETIASLFLEALFQMAYAATPYRRSYQLFLDEFFHLLTPNLEKRFTTGLVSLRSFRVSIHLIMHEFSQVSTQLRKIMLGSADTFAVFRTTRDNASHINFLPKIDSTFIRDWFSKAGQLPSKSELVTHQDERLERLPNRHLYWYDRRRPFPALLVRARAFEPPHKVIGISEGALVRFIDNSGIATGGMGLTKDELRAQIQRREQRLSDLVRPPVQLVNNQPPNELPPTISVSSDDMSKPRTEEQQSTTKPRQRSKRKPRIG